MIFDSFVGNKCLFNCGNVLEMTSFYLHQGGCAISAVRLLFILSVVLLPQLTAKIIGRFCRNLVG